MHIDADSLELLDHEPPARRRLQRHLEILARELLQELPYAGTSNRSMTISPAVSVALAVTSGP